MANTPVVVLDDTLTDIADAIRAKTGGSATMTPSEMPTEIASIPSGGGGADNNWAQVMRRQSTDLYDNSITSIGSYGVAAQSGQAYITSMSFPLVTEVGSYAFSNQNQAVTISIPALADITESYVFYYCSNLAEIKLPALAHSSATVSLSSVFMYCSNIEKIDLGNNNATFTSRFSSYCFANCPILKALILRWDSMVTLYNGNAFNSSGIATGDGYIYVPKSRVDEYKVANKWSTYANQIRAIEDYSVDGTVEGDIIV